MKKITLLLLILLPTLIFAQETDNKTENIEKKTNKTFSFKPQIYTYANHHINFGNNFLADGHEANFVGLGIQLNLVKYQDFKFGIGWEFNNYDVTNPSTIGNIDKSSYFALFGKIQYQWNVLNRWSVEPYLGIGATKMQQKYDYSNYDSFYGMNLYLGSNLTFKLTNYVSIFTGFNYNHIRFNIETNEKWEDYFNKANQVQIPLGIIISIDKN